MLTGKNKQIEFRNLYEPHSKSLKNTAFRLTRNDMEAQDLLQESLYKAYRGFSSFAPDTNFRAWIFRILINTYLTHYRKRVKQPLKVSYDELEEFTLYQKSDLDYEETVKQVERIGGEMFDDDVQNALEKMPYYFRLIVLLYDVEGFSYQEIASMVQIPVGTVMSRLNRGRNLLRRKLKRYAGNKGYVIEKKIEPNFAN
jgi:RNA polymerase sigma-70 factor (ECF subfamily)